MKPPKCIDFTPEQIEGLIVRLESKSLKEEDYPLLQDILKAMIWLSFSLQEKELSIKRLRKFLELKRKAQKNYFNFLMESY